MSELTKALKNMKNNKSPGTDGFSSKFFKVGKNRNFCYAISKL